MIDVYVVRVRHDSDDPLLLSGTVESVATGERRPFRDCDQLVAALTARPDPARPLRPVD